MQERENLYRFGVLMGNWVEETLVRDAETVPPPPPPCPNLTETQAQFGDPRARSPEQRDPSPQKTCQKTIGCNLSGELAVAGGAISEGTPLQASQKGTYHMENFGKFTNPTPTVFKNCANDTAKTNWATSSGPKPQELIDRFVLENYNGKKEKPATLSSHLFFGHGLNLGDFHKRELVSTNSLSYGLRMNPKQFLGRGVEVEKTLKETVEQNKFVLSKENVASYRLPKSVDVRKKGKEFSRRFDKPEQTLHLRI